jgi:hypothetical protein
LVGFWGREQSGISQLGMITRGPDCSHLPIFVLPTNSITDSGVKPDETGEEDLTPTSITTHILTIIFGVLSLIVLLVAIIMIRRCMKRQQNKELSIVNPSVELAGKKLADSFFKNLK